MSSRAPWFITFLFACAAAGAGVWGYQEHNRAAGLAELDLDRQKIALLEDDNARLQTLVADQKKTISRADETAERKTIENAVVGIRGLDFKHPVDYETLTRAGLTKTLEEKLSEQYSDKDFQNFGKALGAFGLIEPGYPLKEKYLALLSEQIAAFYDQHQHKLFMFEDASLHVTQNRIVLAHELTHALQDQHFGLLLMPLEVKNNDDLAIATSALIEGDATVVMTDYMMKNFSLKALKENLSGIGSTSMKQLKDSPRYLREMLMFPYVRGQEFCAVLMEHGGYAAISEAYKNPPSSTTQILHPEKYLAHEDPIRIEWQDTDGPGGKPIDDNVLGEFGIRILFGQWVDDATSLLATEGWRGDRFLVFDDGKALVWKTVWDNDQHSQKFRDAMVQYVGKRFKGATTDATGPDCTFTSPEATGEIISTKTGNGVIFIWGATKELNDALVAKFRE